MLINSIYYISVTYGECARVYSAVEISVVCWTGWWWAKNIYQRHWKLVPICRSRSRPRCSIMASDLTNSDANIIKTETPSDPPSRAKHSFPHLFRRLSLICPGFFYRTCPPIRLCTRLRLHVFSSRFPGATFMPRVRRKKDSDSIYFPTISLELLLPARRWPGTSSQIVYVINHWPLTEQNIFMTGRPHYETTSGVCLSVRLSVCRIPRPTL